MSAKITIHKHIYRDRLATAYTSGLLSVMDIPEHSEKWKDAVQFGFDWADNDIARSDVAMANMEKINPQ